MESEYSILEFIEKLYRAVFPLVFDRLWYNWLCLILYEKYWMSLRTSCLIKKLRYTMFLTMDLIDFGIVVNHSLYLTDKFGSYFIRTIGLKLTRCRACVISFGTIQIFSNPLCHSKIDTQTLWNHCIRSSSLMPTVQCAGEVNFIMESEYSILQSVQRVAAWLLEERISSWVWFLPVQSPVKFSLMHKTKCTRRINMLKWQFTHSFIYQIYIKNGNHLFIRLFF